MSEYNIPEDEVENVLSVYWSMLRVLESRTIESDVITKMLVDDAYTLLNRINATDARPVWEFEK